MPEVVSAFRSFWVGNCAAVSDGWSGVCARTAPGTVAIAVPMSAMAATVQRLKRFENIRARLELVVPGWSRRPCRMQSRPAARDPEPSGPDNAAFGVWPQGFGPRDRLRAPQTGHERPKTPLLWPYRDHRPPLLPGPHANVRHNVLARVVPPESCPRP